MRINRSIFKSTEEKPAPVKAEKLGYRGRVTRRSPGESGYHAEIEYVRENYTGTTERWGSFKNENFYFKFQAKGWVQNELKKIKKRDTYKEQDNVVYELAI